MPYPREIIGRIPARRRPGTLTTIKRKHHQPDHDHPKRLADTIPDQMGPQDNPWENST